MQRLILLTSHPQLYTPGRLRDELRVLHVDCEFFRPGDPAAEIVTENGCERPWILTRAGPFNLRPVLRAQRQLECHGARAWIQRSRFLDAADQWRTLRHLRRAGIPVPRSVLRRSPSAGEHPGVPGPPWYVKGRLGSKGSHVMLAEDLHQLERHVRLLWGQGGSAIVQEDRRRTGPVRRVLVLGERVVACVRAEASDGEHRSNWHRGGQLLAERTAGAVPDLAVRAVRALGLPWAGVDVIGERNPAVLEVNASPGLEGLERATDRNQAAEFARFLRRGMAGPMQSSPVL